MDCPISSLGPCLHGGRECDPEPLLRDGGVAQRWGFYGYSVEVRRQVVLDSAHSHYRGRQPMASITLDRERPSARPTLDRCLIFINQSGEGSTALPDLLDPQTTGISTGGVLLRPVCNAA